MRTIKFRAWDTILKMWTNYRIEDDMIYIMVKTAGTWIRHDVRNDGRFQLMQFTGLLDKNGKEIYEGDVFKWGDYVGEVKFNFGCFTFCYGYGLNPPNLTGEVIGNIYENPELLNK